MQTMAASVAAWVDLSVELVRRPHVDFPRAAIADHLAETFDAFVAWIWLSADGSFGYELNGLPPGPPCGHDVDDLALAAVRHHPLLQWYGRSEPTPMSVHRLPRQLVAAAEWSQVVEVLVPQGLEQQLAIPHRSDHATFRAFVMARGEQDFTDDEVDLARQIQPLIAMLDRHADVLHGVPVGAGPAEEVTAREVAVLRLLAEGFTAGAIGHRLDVSQRTVHAHLRSIYRKLDVNDRLQAVVAAGELGLVWTDESRCPPRGVGLPGPTGQQRELAPHDESDFWGIVSGSAPQ